MKVINSAVCHFFVYFHLFGFNICMVFTGEVQVFFEEKIG